MIEFYFPEDTWVDVTLDDGTVVDMNLWIDDRSGRQHVSFYPTQIDGEGFRTTDATKTLASFQVNETGEV